MLLTTKPTHVDSIRSFQVHGRYHLCTISSCARFCVDDRGIDVYIYRSKLYVLFEYILFC